MITPERATDIRTRNNRLKAWLDSIRGKNEWASYRREDKPADVPDAGRHARVKESRKAQRLHDLANIFESSFGGVQ